MSTVKVEQDVRAENLRRAEALRERYAREHVRVIGLLGSPGSGKTTLLEHLLPVLKQRCRVAVVEGDVATDHDAKRVEQTGVAAVQIETGGACHLDTAMVENAVDRLPLGETDLLFIENVGNLVCPVGFPLGETLRIAVISAAEGEDKPLKYPSAVLRTDAVILTKTDLAPYVRVDPAKMAEYVRAINPRSRIFYSRFEGDGLCFEAADGGSPLLEYLRG